MCIRDRSTMVRPPYPESNTPIGPGVWDRCCFMTHLIYIRKCTPKKGKEKEDDPSFSFPFGISLFLVSSYLIPRFAFTLLVKLMLCDSFT